jgi:hypothetical protein
MEDWKMELERVFHEFVDALEKAGHVASAQAAMGWMFQGDLQKARDVLSDLPMEQLRAISVTASALSSLSDEIATEKT